MEKIFDAAREEQFVLVKLENWRVFLDDVERDGHVGDGLMTLDPKIRWISAGLARAVSSRGGGRIVGLKETQSIVRGVHSL